MIEPRPELLAVLRAMAFRGRPASEMLRLLALAHAPDQLHPVELDEYLSRAFLFREGEASPVHGWVPDGRGELDDVRFDYLMGDRIARTRPAWEAAVRDAPAA